ncbi:MAG: TetR family transcriptional regulator [Armatimonadetes bacterium]|nr:TetR family transcriptional regulator [Armatimonadota bacterium]
MALVNLEDPRVKRTRRLLVAAFEQLVAEKSFRHITVQEVAAAAGVNRATFYDHFEDKYALLEAAVVGSFEQVLAEQLPPAERFGVEDMPRLAATMLEFVAGTFRSSRRADRQFDPLIESSIRETLHDYLRRWLAARVCPRSASASSTDTAACVLSWGMFGVARQWSREGRKRPAEQVAAEIVEVLGRLGLPAT